MKNWFFHQEKGKTLGPIKLDEIQSRVREGRIRLFDLVYREGDSGWRMAVEHPDLRGEFKNSQTEKMVDRPWVCLQKKPEGGFEFSTSGPFSTEEMRAFIQEGKVSYGDFVWRDGYGEWKRIGSIEDFNRRLAGAKDRRREGGGEVPAAAIPASELLKNVVEMKRGRPAAAPEDPPEAATPDLTLPPPVTDMPSRIKRGKEERVASKPVKKERRRRAIAEEETPRRRAPAWLDWALVLLLVSGLGGGGFYYLKFVRPSAENADAGDGIDARIDKPLAPAPAPEAELPPTPEPPPVPIAPAPETVAAKTAPKDPSVEANPRSFAPTELTLNVQATGANQVKIELRTDAAGEENPVYLQIVGLPGQVADGASYYKFLKLSAKGDRKAPLDLSGLDLPQGRFIFRAEAGELKKEAKLSVGVNEAQFKQTVARLRKVHAHQIWKERLELMRLTQVLDKALTEAIGGKKFSGKGLDAVNKVKRTNGANYVLFDHWFELKEILVQAKTAPNIALLGRLKQEREKLTVFSVWK